MNSVSTDQANPVTVTPVFGGRVYTRDELPAALVTFLTGVER